MSLVETQEVKHLEDFMPEDGGADIFQKAENLTAFLEKYPQDCLQGLGLQILGPAGPTVRIREDNEDGNTRPPDLRSLNGKECTERLDITGASLQQIAGVCSIVVGAGQALDVVVQAVAQIAGDCL